MQSWFLMAHNLEAVRSPSVPHTRMHIHAHTHDLQTWQCSWWLIRAGIHWSLDIRNAPQSYHIKRLNPFKTTQDINLPVSHSIWAATSFFTAAWPHHVPHLHTITFSHRVCLSDVWRTHTVSTALVRSDCSSSVRSTGVREHFSFISGIELGVSTVKKPAGLWSRIHSDPELKNNQCCENGTRAWLRPPWRLASSNDRPESYGCTEVFLCFRSGLVCVCVSAKTFHGTFGYFTVKSGVKGNILVAMICFCVVHMNIYWTSFYTKGSKKSIILYVNYTPSWWTHISRNGNSHLSCFFKVFLMR